MPRYTLILLCLFFGNGIVIGQNLVTNPGFEKKHQCPNDRGEIFVLPGYVGFPTATDWVSPVNTTPDYFNTCGTNTAVKLPDLSLDGYHEAHSGDACAGISIISCLPYADTSDYWSEYLETKLASPLEAGHSYYICYYVCLTYHDREYYNIISVDNIGARLTTQMIDTSSPGPMYFVNGPADISSPTGFFITDTTNWTLVSGIYKARGGEQWLTIGRFYNGSDSVNFQLLRPRDRDVSAAQADTEYSSVCYMLVDDVCALDMASPYITDTVLYSPQFPIAIGLGKGEGQYLWYNGDTSQQISITGPGSYYRQRWEDCGYYIDTFTVTQVPLDYCVLLPNAFTPNGDGLNDLFGPGDSYCQPDFSEYNFYIYNRWGQVVFQSFDPGAKWDGRYNGASMEVGVYFYTLKYTYQNSTSPGSKAMSTQPQSVFIKGDVTLIR